MSTSVWVVNASPLICLAKIGQLGLLVSKAGQPVVPDAVAVEVMNAPEADPARLAVASGFGARHPPQPVDLRVAQWGLGGGESAVLTVAHELGATAIIDDRDARVAAKALGIASMGSSREPVPTGPKLLQ